MDTEILVTPDGREWQPYIPPEPPPPPPPPSFDLYRVKKWGEDAVMNFHGYTTKNLTGGNFQVVGLLVEDKTGFWGADQVGHKVKIDKDTIDKIAALQPFDSDWSLDQKMKWLMNGEKGRPYFFEKGLDWGWDDKFTEYVYYGPMVYGGQLVAVDEYRTVRGTYRERKHQKLKCGRVVPFTRNDWGKSPDEYRYLIQKATAAYKVKYPDGTTKADNVYVEEPRGIINAPIFAPNYGKFLGLGGYQPQEYLIPLEMLVKV